jgi:peptidylprolyl isomerase
LDQGRAYPAIFLPADHNSVCRQIDQIAFALGRTETYLVAQANSGDTVRMHYSGKLTDGSLFDSSEGGDPLEFKIGENTIIPKLEASVIGMAVGDKATIDVGFAEAYGPRSEDAVQAVERSMIPDEVDLTVGGQLQATAPDGKQLILTVLEVNEESVRLDGNHPLAGQDLVFDIELVEILAAQATGL